MYTVGAFLIRGEWSLMEKIYKTQTERIDLLVKRGMTIEESSKKILEKYSHYNLRLYTKSGAWKNSSPGFQFLYTKRQIPNIIKV